MAQLSGTGRLADDLWLMAHHEVTGKPYLQPRATGLGLAGALLAELVLGGDLLAWPDGVAATGDARPDDGLASLVLGHVLQEPEPHPAREWLLFLGGTAAGRVARRLEDSGYLALSAARRPWRAQRRVPVNADCAFAPLARVQYALRSSRPAAAAHGVVLAGLADACGLGPRLQAYLPPGARLALAHYATLLGVPPGNTAAWVLPASYAAAALTGLAWGLVLKTRRPQVYAAIGLGAHAVTGQRAPATGPAPR